MLVRRRCSWRACRPLERAIGQDRLVRWHRRLGPWPLYLLLAHVVLIVVGYAQAAHDGLLHQLGQLALDLPGHPGRGRRRVLLVAAGVSSYRRARRRMAYETWWTVHLYTYLALFLAFLHQVERAPRSSVTPRRGLVDGALDRRARARDRLARRAAGLALAAPPHPRRRGRARGARRVLGPARGPPARPAARRRRPVLPVALPAARPVVAGAPVLALGHARTADRLRITVKDLGDHSRRARPIDPARASLSRGPTAPSPPTRPTATGCCSSAPASARPRCARCCRSSAGRRRRRPLRA